MERKDLGRIERAEFGWGGYQDAMLGLSLTFAGKAWGVSHFDGTWGTKRSEHAQWTEESRVTQLGEVVMRLKDTLKAAKVDSVSKLVGKPVECTFEGMTLKSWRVLEEVL